MTISFLFCFGCLEVRVTSSPMNEITLNGYKKYGNKNKNNVVNILPEDVKVNNEYRILKVLAN